MKTRDKKITVQVCDACDRDADMPAKCLGCGKCFCWDCRKSCGKEYQQGVYACGAGDGFYCFPCDASMGTDALHRAYLKIQDLRREYERYAEDFDVRRKAAEAELQKVRKT